MMVFIKYVYKMLMGNGDATLFYYIAQKKKGCVPNVLNATLKTVTLQFI